MKRIIAALVFLLVSLGATFGLGSSPASANGRCYTFGSHTDWHWADLHTDHHNYIGTGQVGGIWHVIYINQEHPGQAWEVPWCI